MSLIVTQKKLLQSFVDFTKHLAELYVMDVMIHVWKVNRCRQSKHWIHIHSDTEPDELSNECNRISIHRSVNSFTSSDARFFLYLPTARCTAKAILLTLNAYVNEMKARDEGKTTSHHIVIIAKWFHSPRFADYERAQRLRCWGMFPWSPCNPDTRAFPPSGPEKPKGEWDGEAKVSSEAFAVYWRKPT